MTMYFYGQELSTWVIVLLVVWELIWKGLALWKSAQQNQRYWFVALLFINTIGILPILYLLFFQNKKLEDYPLYFGS